MKMTLHTQPTTHHHHKLSEFQNDENVSDDEYHLISDKQGKTRLGQEMQLQPQLQLILP